MATQGAVIQNEDGTVRFETRCMLCSQPNALDKLDAKAFSAWQAGEFVQFAFPDLSDSEREVLVSGSHAECFEAVFADDEDEEEDFPEE